MVSNNKQSDIETDPQDFEGEQALVSAKFQDNEISQISN